MAEPTISIEKHGGFAGFGGAHLKSRGDCALAALSQEDRDQVEALFRDPARAGPVSDGGDPSTRYTLTRVVAGKAQSVDVAEAVLPTSLRACVRDVIE